MSSVWNGSYLQDYYLKKYGFSDSASATRVLQWINDIQDDLQASHSWPFLKFKLKKQVSNGDQEIDISPQIPSAPSIALASGGSFQDSTVAKIKVTFLIFDESGKEVNSLESESSAESNAVTFGGGNNSFTVSGLSTYNGVTTVKPTTIYRKIYVKIGSNPYFYSQTIADNTTITATVSTVPSSTIEPPEYSLVALMSGEDPFVENAGISLYQNKLDDLIKFDPTFRSTGTPQYYARVSPTKILLYPRPSSTYTLSYWVYKIPSRIFADSDRPIQIHHALKEALDAGITWKGYEYKDQDGQESKKLNYELRKQDAKGVVGRNGGISLAVKEVC